jgi:hypothetical protein
MLSPIGTNMMVGNTWLANEVWTFSGKKLTFTFALDNGLGFMI